MIPFGEWLPDQQDLNNPGTTLITNAMPHAMGYRPWLGPAVFSDALAARCQGAISIVASDGIAYTYAGTGTKLYTLEDVSWTDVTRVSGGDYATDSEGVWAFAVWGTDFVIGVNYADDTQIIEAGTANFSALSGSPPKAKAIAVCRNFVILGSIDDGGTAYPNRVQWSGIGSPVSWAASPVTQADSEDLQESGEIFQLFGGEYCVVMCERAIFRMDYVGTPVIWEIDQVSPNVGVICAGMAAQIGDSIFFLSQRGFYELRGGHELRPIGANKVDRYVLNDLDTSFLGRCIAVADDRANRVFFAYPGEGNTAGEANRLLVYDLTLDSWGYSEQTVQELFQSAPVGITMDGASGMDSVNTNLDLIVPDMDSDTWKGGRTQLSAFDEDNKLVYFTGSPLAAVLETPEVEITPGTRTLLSTVRPLVDGGSTTVQVGTRNTQAESETWSAAATPNSNGRANVRKNARYHRMRLNISGEWNYAQGVDPEGAQAGWR